MTQEFLQDAVKADLEELFRDYTLRNSLGVERPVSVFAQDVPVRAGIDETEEPEDLPEPYVVVRTIGGEVPGYGQERTVKVVLVVCAQDESRDRQGHRDVLHILNEICLHYGRGSGVVGGKFALQYPITWETQTEDIHPLYFGAMALSFTAATIYQEEPEL